MSNKKYKIGFYGGKFMPFHLGHIYCIKEALKKCDMLYVALFYKGEIEKEVLSKNWKFDKKMLDWKIRDKVIKETIKDIPNVKYIAFNCDEADKEAIEKGLEFRYVEAKYMKDIVGDLDAIFASEDNFKPWLKKLYPTYNKELIDVNRKNVNISGTKIRNMDIEMAMDYLPNAYKKIIKEYLNNDINK